MIAPTTPTAMAWRALQDAHRTHRALLVAPLVALGVFLVCAAFFDAPVTRALTTWPDHERAFFLWLTDWGKSDWILAPTLVATLAAAAGLRADLGYSWRHALAAVRTGAGFIFLAVGVPGVVVWLLKRIIGRARPFHLDTLGPFHFEPFTLFDATFQSFPSGHSTTAMAFAIVLVILFGRRFRGWFIALGIAIALSRIVTGEHFLSDTVFGVALGAAGALIVRDAFVTRGWGFRMEGGRVRNRLPIGFARLWRVVRWGQRPALLR